MAKPIEIAFSLVWSRASVERLTMPELGGFVLLAHAYLKTGFDPFTARQSILCSKARSTTQQWTAGGKAILAALRDALPVLEENYTKACEKRAALSKRAQVNLEKYRFEWNEGQRKERKAHNFSPQSFEPTILQPMKAPRYRPENTDILARQNALLAKKDKLKTFRFTDKT